MYLGPLGELRAGAAEDNEARARQFIRRHEETVRPLEIEVARCWWTANATGKEEDFRRKEEAEARLDLKLADPVAFAELKAIHEGPPQDPLLARQIAVLYLQYRAKQVEPELLRQMLARSNAVEKAFNVFRAKVDGRELTDNQVREILRKSTSSRERRAAWEASKVVGRVVLPDLKELVKLRNTAARKLGFPDFHAMQLALAEQDQKEVLRLFDELDELTRPAYRSAKAEIDAVLARNCGVSVAELRPWHYHDPFCQESPAVFGEDAHGVYAGLDILQVCQKFFGGIGLPVDDILARSDLYERPGKNPHAFCIDIDREGDVRVMANVVPGREWLSTMIHELGHGVYSSKNIPSSVPYVLRTDSHALTTEGIAMMFERFVESAAWLEAMGAKVPNPSEFDAAAAKVRRNRLLIFSRWSQVMFRFEKALYANPDQDLNKLWWDLVEKYQEVQRPEERNEPDFAAKIHIVTVPCYYHNYLLGELFAAQVHAAICREVLGGVVPATAMYAGNKQVGAFLRQRVFAPGRALPWNALTRHATGADLSPLAFAAEITAAPGSDNVPPPKKTTKEK